MACVSPRTGVPRRGQAHRRSLAMSGSQGGWDPNEDDRSEEQIQADNDNHANQCNPNNDEYDHSREAGSLGNDDDD